MGVRFGTAARNARIDREVSLKTVADRLGFTPAYISDIERGNRNPPSIEKVRIWANAVEIEPELFIRLAEEDRPSVELPIQGDPRKAELALMLLRQWDSLTDDQESQLLEAVKRIVGA